MIGLVVVAAVTITLLLVPFLAWAAEPVGLGAANSFAVLAGTTITNTGATTITGDVGLHDGTATPGFDQVTLNGQLFVANAEALEAKNALTAAYLDAAGRIPDDTIGTELGGTTLVGGVYASGSGAFGITGSLTLDAQGDPDAVFIFQMASTLTTAAGSSVVFLNGAQACNVYWQVGSSATLGSNSTFRGTILALTSISLGTGAAISGRALARNGAVTMDSNTITRIGCAAPVVTTTTTTTTVATTTTTTAAATTTTTTTVPDATTTTLPGATTTTVAADGTTTTVAVIGFTAAAAAAATTTTTAAAETTSTTWGISALVTGTIAPPAGGVQTGGGSTSGTTNMTLVAVGALLLAGAAGLFGWRTLSIRRTRRDQSVS